MYSIYYVFCANIQIVKYKVYLLIHYKENAYRKNLLLNCSGDDSNPIVIYGVKSDNDELPTIRGESNTLPVITLDYYKKNIEIRNLKITGGYRGIRTLFCENIVIAENHIEFNGDSTESSRQNRGAGLELKAGKDISVKENTINNNFAGIGGAIHSSCNNLHIMVSLK